MQTLLRTTRLPSEYVDFISAHNGGEGFLGERYVCFWKIDELLSLNSEYAVEMRAPGIFLFGSDGAGEGYGFDLTQTPMPVVLLPFIGMARARTHVIVANFSELFDRLSVAEDVALRGEPNMQLVEIKPIILGGDPKDPKNKMWVNRRQHIELVRYWNGVLADRRQT